MEREPEPESTLYAQHEFVSGESVARLNYLSENGRKEMLIVGWRCAVCRHTRPECERRNPLRPPVIFMSTTGINIMTKKLNIWFEVGVLCLEFDGEYEPRASWYRPLMTRIRMELGSSQPHQPQGWLKGSGGSHNAVWRIALTNSSLRAPLSPVQAHAAVMRAVEAFRSFPHNLELIVEEL